MDIDNWKQVVMGFFICCTCCVMLWVMKGCSESTDQRAVPEKQADHYCPQQK